MENITTGHWIFAGIFAVAFIIYMIWAYRKDLKLHKIHYNKSSLFLLAVLLILFLLFIFRRVFQ
ncbi:MAG: hypothetical protein ACPGEC_04095 [Flavobacteriales bacterium]